jgi:hypothetical protein
MQVITKPEPKRHGLYLYRAEWESSISVDKC